MEGLGDAYRTPARIGAKAPVFPPEYCGGTEKRPDKQYSLAGVPGYSRIPARFS
jgi:hypothetical protein